MLTILILMILGVRSKCMFQIQIISGMLNVNVNRSENID